jgi:hypothetical protein
MFSRFFLFTALSHLVLTNNRLLQLSVQNSPEIVLEGDGGDANSNFNDEDDSEQDGELFRETQSKTKLVCSHSCFLSSDKLMRRATLNLASREEARTFSFFFVVNCGKMVVT